MYLRPQVGLERRASTRKFQRHYWGQGVGLQEQGILTTAPRSRPRDRFPLRNTWYEDGVSSPLFTPHLGHVRDDISERKSVRGLAPLPRLRTLIRRLRRTGTSVAGVFTLLSTGGRLVSSGTLWPPFSLVGHCGSAVCGCSCLRILFGSFTYSSAASVAGLVVPRCVHFAPLTSFPSSAAFRRESREEFSHLQEVLQHQAAELTVARPDLPRARREQAAGLVRFQCITNIVHHPVGTVHGSSPVPTKAATQSQPLQCLPRLLPNLSPRFGIQYTEGPYNTVRVLVRTTPSACFCRFLVLFG